MNEQNKKQKRSRYKEDGFEAWGGYMNAKITKLEEQFEEDTKNLDHSEKLSNIFQGVAIFVNGYTEPSADDLRLLMLLHGGTYHHYYRSEKTTHVIASNLPNAKMAQLKTMKVVTPDWIVKSIKAGKLLDYKKFTLFSKPHIFQVEANENSKTTVNKVTSAEDLKSRQQNVAKTAVDAHFLSEFYSNSRLHHLSTMGAMFKQYVGELKEKFNGVYPGRGRILKQFENTSKEAISVIDKVIMHIDMDCFFVSVALRNHPELKGKPVAVAHARGNPTHQRAGVNPEFEYKFYKRKMGEKLGLDNENSSESSDSGDENDKPWLSEFNSRSEVASCSYEARKAGVRNGMYLGSALKVCPDLQTVPYDFEGYKEVSYTLYNTLAEYTLDIEAVSCDELFIDATSLIRDVQIKPLDFAKVLRSDIYERTRCPSSVGIGSNKLQARLATKRAKPNGQFFLQPGDVLSFMSEVNVYDLPGVGRTLGYKLKALDVRTCLDLQNIPLSLLKKEFGGKTGETLYKHCRGIDERIVNNAHERKSVSAEVNYGIRFTKEEEAVTFLKQLSGEVSNRLKEVNMKGRSITFKVMIRAKDAPAETAKFLGHGACDYTTRSVRLTSPTDDADVISKNVLNMYAQLSVPASELRGIGIQITKLEACKQKTGALHNFLKQKEKNLLNAAPARPSTSRDAAPVPLRPEPQPDKIQLPPLSQIDRSVFDSLPEELRSEILSEYQLSVGEFVAAAGGTKSLRKEEPRVNELTGDMEESDNVFSSLTISQMRGMIREWVSVEDEPKQFDVNMMLKYIQNLIRKKRIEQVDVLVKCFHRHICNKKDGANWKNCYRQVVSQMQLTMKEVFGKEMLVQEL